MRLKIIIISGLLLVFILLGLFGGRVQDFVAAQLFTEGSYVCKGSFCGTCIINNQTCICDDTICNCGEQVFDREVCEIL